jgi:hypothetical protein
MSKKATIALFIFSVIIFMFMFYVIWGSLKENASLEQPRVFHIPFDHYFYTNETLRIANLYPDIQIDLLLYYPKGFLVVDDPVKISGTAFAYTPVTQNITKIDVNFLGTQAYPEKQDVNGITQGVNLVLNRTPNSNKFVGNETTMVWKLEGAYFPRLYITGYKKNTTIYSPTNDIAITVYPKSESAQIVTNKAILWLTIVGVILTILGFIYIIINEKDNEDN